MAFQLGQEVRIKNTRHIIGKIVRLRDSNPIDGDVYVVEIDPQTIILRAASLEALDESKAETKNPKVGTPEWIAEAQRAPSILQAALDNPNDLAIRDAVFQTLEKLGIIVPISAFPTTHS